MAALNRDSVLSTTSTGSGEVETLSMRQRQQDSVDNTGPRETYHYVVDYENIDAQLKEQEKEVTKIRRKLGRLKTNFCILIVFLVNIIFTHMFYIVNIMHVKGNLPSGCSGILWISSLGTLEDAD